MLNLVDEDGNYFRLVLYKKDSAPVSDYIQNEDILQTLIQFLAEEYVDSNTLFEDLKSESLYLSNISLKGFTKALQSGQINYQEFRNSLNGTQKPWTANKVGKSYECESELKIHAISVSSPTTLKLSVYQTAEEAKDDAVAEVMYTEFETDEELFEAVRKAKSKTYQSGYKYVDWTIYGNHNFRADKIVETPTGFKLVDSSGESFCNCK